MNNKKNPQLFTEVIIKALEDGFDASVIQTIIYNAMKKELDKNNKNKEKS